MKISSFAFLLIAPGLFFLPGCTGLDLLEPREDLTRFYLFESSLDPDQIEALDPEGLRVHLGTGSLGKHLQDSRLAIRTPGSNEIAYAEQHRWAEPLADGVARVLLSRLSHNLGSSRVALQRFAAGSKNDYLVGFHLHELGGKPGQTVRLHASWWVQAWEENEPVLHNTLLEESLDRGATSHAAFVKGLQQLVEAWAVEIAATLKP